MSNINGTLRSDEVGFIPPLKPPFPILLSSSDNTSSSTASKSEPLTQIPSVDVFSVHDGTKLGIPIWTIPILLSAFLQRLKILRNNTCARVVKHDSLDNIDMSGAEITVDMDTLTKCITLLIGDHYTCLNIRRELLAKNELTLPSELKFNKLLLSKWYKSSGLWWHRFRVVQQFLDCKTSVHQPTRCRELYQNESDFLKSILLRDGRNYYVWLYKIRLLKLMSRSVDSSDFFNQILKEERNTLQEYTSRNPSNYSAFSYRLQILLLTVNQNAPFESRSLPTNSHASHLANVSGSIAPSFKTESNTLILRDEFTSIFAIIKSYSHFEAPWSYLKSLLTLLVRGSYARLSNSELSEGLSAESRVRQVLQHVLDEETVGGIMEVIRYGTTVDVNQENLYGEEESKMCVQRKNDFVSWLNKML